MPKDLFGPLVSPEDVIDAAVDTLRIWLPTYIAEVERQKGIAPKTIPRPPAPESYHGGVDLEAWIGADAPEVMVVVKPSGEPERSASAGYTQGYTLEIGCLCVGTGSSLAERAEDEARIIASYLGAATMLLIQQPTLGGLTERLVMTAAPDVSLPDPDRRSIAQVVTEFEVWISQIIEESAGPVGPNPQESPGYEGQEEPFEEVPVAKDGAVAVKAVPTAKPL